MMMELDAIIYKFLCNRNKLISSNTYSNEYQKFEELTENAYTLFNMYPNYEDYIVLDSSNDYAFKISSELYTTVISLNYTSSYDLIPIRIIFDEYQAFSIRYDRNKKIFYFEIEVVEKPQIKINEEEFQDNTLIFSTELSLGITILPYETILKMFNIAHLVYEINSVTRSISTDTFSVLIGIDSNNTIKNECEFVEPVRQYIPDFQYIKREHLNQEHIDIMLTHIDDIFTNIKNNHIKKEYNV